MTLARAAKEVRKVIFHQICHFNGTFTEDSLQNLVPRSTCTDNIILEDQIKHQSELVTAATTMASHSIAQLVMFNSVKHTRGVGSATVRHQSEHETLTPIYVALKIHAATDSLSLIDALFNLGLVFLKSNLWYIQCYLCTI